MGFVESPTQVLLGVVLQALAARLTTPMNAQASMNMARVEVKYGTHQPLKALATQLIVMQTLQVEQMRSVLSRDYSTFV